MCHVLQHIEKFKNKEINLLITDIKDRDTKILLRDHECWKYTYKKFFVVYSNKRINMDLLEKRNKERNIYNESIIMRNKKCSSESSCTNNCINNCIIKNTIMANN
ncbi:MAG: hypothetical protein N4A57_10290 [Anaeromicrobium sp.]|jgi:hypothetical protein|uniref:hypothetical protein n=1 Tax=Anaeromicrobium sp. TaxID=1929132 RepID=UPI0025E3BC01|nr:hypothetical protein [Anaeromicrobium sp.]MCT4594638.1 hypothetical protein [Anaeromicrobium sp.]